MTLTKAKIVERLFAQNLFTKTESAQIIETLFELMKQRLEAREEILISGFGKFQLREKASRRGRNPHTGATIKLQPRVVVTFKCSATLRERMNSAT
jgi:integration host factor subunit alpha